MMPPKKALLSLSRRGFLLALGAACLAGCGGIATEPGPSSSARLTPNPPHIYVAPFRIDTAQWLSGRPEITKDGFDTESEFKKDYQMKFLYYLKERLSKVAPTSIRWVDDLPDQGWLVTGDFLRVYQGSRGLRTIVGAGLGETTLQTRVYVYDLSKSKTHYILSFTTGVLDPDGTPRKAGSGQQPGIISGGIAPVGAVAAPFQAGAGLNLDGTRTAREIRDILWQYITDRGAPHQTSNYDR